MSLFTFIKQHIFKILIGTVALFFTGLAIAVLTHDIGIGDFYLSLLFGYLAFFFLAGGVAGLLIAGPISLILFIFHLSVSVFFVYRYEHILTKKGRTIFVAVTFLIFSISILAAWYTIRQLSYAGYSVQDCENISSLWYIPRKISKQRCFSELASREQDVTICNNIKSPLEPELENDAWDSAQDFRGYCIDGAVPTRTDQKLKNVSKCALLEESESRDDCYYRVVYSAGRLPAEKSKEICALITEIERKNSCFLHVIDFSGDVNICRSLVDPNDGTFDSTLASCYLRVVESKKLSLLSEGEKTCALITSNHYSTGVTEPRDRCFRALAERYKDIKICSRIEDSTWKSVCERGVIWEIKEETEALPLKERLERECASADNNSVVPRDPCFRNLAEKYRDINICLKIQDSGLKAKCEEYFVRY